MNDVTHLGLQDIPMLGNIPNLVYLAPVTKEDYLAMLDWSMEQREHPVAIKLPGGKLISDGKAVTKDFGKLNKYEVTQEGSKVAVIGLGAFYGLGQAAADLLQEKTGTQATVINPYYIDRGRYRAAGRTEKASFCCGHTGGWNSGRRFR